MIKNDNIYIKLVAQESLRGLYHTLQLQKGI